MPVLKTGDGVTHPRVQISPPPPLFQGLQSARLLFLINHLGTVIKTVTVFSCMDRLSRLAASFKSSSLVMV